MKTLLPPLAADGALYLCSPVITGIIESAPGSLSHGVAGEFRQVIPRAENSEWRLSRLKSCGNCGDHRYLFPLLDITVNKEPCNEPEAHNCAENYQEEHKSSFGLQRGLKQNNPSQPLFEWCRPSKNDKSKQNRGRMKIIKERPIATMIRMVFMLNLMFGSGVHPG